MLLALTLACCSLSTARAREESPPADGEEQEPESVAAEVQEEITVTARKREEDLEDVPFSMAAPTGEILRERGAETLEDVAANVASFNVQNLGPGQSQVAMRGVSAGQVFRNQAGVKEQVGIYLDESVVSLSLFTPEIDLFDMQRIEVLRGPQGTLFGSGSLAGTVRYISNQPRLDVSGGTAELSLFSVEEGEASGSAKVALNKPLGDSAALRITAYHTGLAGYTDAVRPDLSVEEDVNGGTRTGTRVALRLAPNDRLSIVPRVFYQEVETDGWNRIDTYNVLANPFTTTRPPVDLDERQQFIQTEEPYTDDFLLADVTIGYDFSDLELTSISSFTDRDILIGRDSTALYAALTGAELGLPEEVFTLDAPYFDRTKAEVMTQELRLAGTTDRWVWLVGGFYSDLAKDFGQSLRVTGFEDLTGIPTRGVLADEDELFVFSRRYDLAQIALFGEATYSLTDRLDVTGGLRYYDFEETRDQIADGFLGPGRTVRLVDSITADGVSPRVVASYAVSDATTLNAQVSNGFRLGGINNPLTDFVRICSPDEIETFGGRQWKDEELWNFEVGSKSTFMQGRGTVNVSAFTMDIEDLQVMTTVCGGAARVFFNVPEARSQGLELELTARPRPSFDFALSTSYTDTELRSSVTSVDADGNPFLVQGLEKGKRLPTAPRFQAALAATYRWRVTDDWAGYLTGTYQHVGSRYTQATDQEEGFGTVNLLARPFPIGAPLTADTFTFDPELPAYDLGNLRLGFFTDVWEVALYVNNLTEERAFLALHQEDGGRARVGYLTNRPRTIGLTTRFRF